MLALTTKAWPDTTENVWMKTQEFCDKTTNVHFDRYSGLHQASAEFPDQGHHKDTVPLKKNFGMLNVNFKALIGV